MAEYQTVTYDNKVVRNFAWATVLWGVVGMLVGVIIAAELFAPGLNMGSEYLTFSRLRPLHTNAIIFAFVGNGVFMGVYYSLQRLCKTRMYSDKLSSINFWGWQLIIVAAAITLPMGLSTSKEYAELIWPIDIAITVIWVVFGWNMIATIIKRNEEHMYVAIWFYIATFLTVALLHVVNSLAIPAGLLSYSIFSGAQDALVQWWYGHNAVAFFLTTPYLGLMYYFLPKAAERPVFSYRLSIIHFWGLIFIYIWAGPHHLLYTSLPSWTQALGTGFSIMLIAPSWGGMLNGLLTLRGAWDKVRTEPVLKFLVVAVTAYGMATFEGPLMALKTVNALSHYTDWTIAHVHVGGLGWNGFLTFGVLYWIIPVIYKQKLFSTKLANFHFWLALLGMLVYVVSMYWAGITQGLMWKQFDDVGSLKYANFLETVIQIVPMYKMRAFGGALYLTGACIMAYNLFMTAVKSQNGVQDDTVKIPLVDPHAGDDHAEEGKKGLMYRHRWLEKKAVLFVVLSFIAVLIGGVIEILPVYLVKKNIPTISSVQPYTPLELYGRDMYIRENCNTCHSQMIRPFRSETERYGEYSKVGEFVYDRPFLWGSKRTGPDLHRIGGKYDNLWQYLHLMNPVDTSPGSIMPAYPWMAEEVIDYDQVPLTINAMRKLGVPYPKNYSVSAIADLKDQAEGISADLKAKGYEVGSDKEIIAIIAYLQRLGTDIKSAPAE